MTAMAVKLVNDLPVKWDGRSVVWREWVAPVGIICARSRAMDRCSECGGKEAPSTSNGLIADTPDITRSQVLANDRSARLGGKRRAWLTLLALRCPECGHDQVRDPDGEWWDLDPSDYGDEGSSPPEQQASLFE